MGDGQDDEMVRIAAASWRSQYVEPRSPIDTLLVGDQWDWAWGLAGTLQAFSTPGGGAAIPALPKPQDPHGQSLGYWGALHYVLLHRLGWERVDLGLQRWIDSASRSDDVTLRIVDAVWGRDGGLDAYRAWTLRTQNRYDLRAGFPVFASEVGGVDPEVARLGHAIAEDPRASKFFYFNVSGSDPLHLGGHLFPAPGPTPDARLIKVNPGSQRAILLSPDMRWYRALLDRDAELPVVGTHSWKVEVHVDSVGLIGTFRKSAVTGLWFTGKHSTHMMGNE